MLKIATHDSATGEKPTWWSYILIPFARTQSKTIREQYEYGCRSFDIRVRKSFGVWKCAHGPFVTKRTARSILEELNSFNSNIQVCITYEGSGKHNLDFMDEVNKWKNEFKNIIYGPISVKYGEGSSITLVKYGYLDDGDPRYEGGVQGFLALDGRSWHTYLPIPWLWNKLYTKSHVFNSEIFTYVDFL